MVSRTRLAVLTAAVLVPVLLIVASAALAQEPVYIVKSDFPDPVYAGEELFYTISITPPEEGPWWVTDTLAPEVTYISDTLEPIPIPGYTFPLTEGCQLVGNELGCLLWSEFGEPRSFQIKTRVAPDAVAGLDTGTVVANNVAWLAYWDGAPEEPGPFAAEGTFIEDLADLAVVKMSKPDTQVRAGEPFEYTIFVENLGPSYARNVAIRDEIVLEPTGGAWIEDVTSELPADCLGWAEPWGLTIECYLYDPLPVKDVDNEGRWAIQVTMAATETQDVNNVVNVFSSDPDGPQGPGMPTADPDLSNNTAEDFISVTDVADLWIDKDVEPSNEWYEYLAGAEVMYTLHVHNEGPSTAENVVIEDLLPAGVTVTYVEEGPASCTTGIPGDPFAPLTCNVGNLAPGEGAIVYVYARIDPDYVDAELPFDSRELQNDAWVYSDIFDPNNGDNRDHTIVDVYTLSQLAITKWGFPEMAGVGDGVEYEIRIWNFGPSTVDTLQFADLLPASVDYVDYYIEQGTGNCVYHDPLSHPWWDEYRGVHCYVDEIPPNGVVMVHLLGTYNESLWWAGSVEEMCNIIPDDDPFSMMGDDWGVDDPWDAPGWWADSYIVIPWENSPIYGEPEYFGWCPDAVYVQADLSIEKTSEPMKLYPGEQKVYHIEVTNNGPTGSMGVMVTDTLPISVTYEIDNGDCELVGSDPDVLECFLGNMMPGETRGFDVWALVSPDAPPGEITNEACVIGEGADPNEEDNCDSATNLVLEPVWADLEITKDYDCEGIPDNGMGCVAGGWVDFFLDVYNHGPLTAENVVLEDLLPEGVTVVGYEGWWNDVPWPELSCNTGIPGNPDAPFTCGLGDVAVGDHVQVNVYAEIDPDYVQPTLPDDYRVMENDALVYSDLHDPNNDNNQTSTLFDVYTMSDVFMWKDGPSDALAGEEISYHIRVRNLGPSTLTNFHFVDDLPEEVTYLGYEIEQGTGECIYPWPMEGDHAAHCYLDDIAPGGVRVVHLRVLVNPDVEDGSYIYNYIGGWFANSGHDVFGPMDVYTYIYNEADLSVWKDAEPWKVYAGEQVMYTVEVANNGPGNAYSVLMTDTLPSEVEFELVTDPACYPTDGAVECYWDVLGLGETKTFYIFGRVLPDAEPGSASNSVEVEAETWDPVEYNDYFSAPVLIQARADLKVQKFGKPEGEVRAGDELTYTVIVDNLGTGYAHGVTLDDLMESDGTFELLGIASDRDALCDPGSGIFTQTLEFTCSLTDALEVKGPEPGSGRWMLTVVVVANERQDINNVAYVAGLDYDPDLSNNEDMAEHEITAVADLELTKEAWGEMLVGCEGETELWLDEVAAGNTVTYTLTVSNTGPSTAENVTVLDEPLPSPELLNIDVESIEASQGECLTGEIMEDGRLACNLGTIAPQESATVSFVAHVPSWVPDYTVLVNDAQVYSDMFDDNNGNDLSTNHLLVSRVADLEVVKTQDPEIALPTLGITYSITVTNLGPSDAEGVFISDTIPVQVLNPVWTCCASDDGVCDIPCEPPTCPVEPCPWPDIGLYAQADIPAGEWAIYTVSGTLDFWPCSPFTNTVEIIPPQSLVHPETDIDPCDENNTDLAVNEPWCHYDPLVLKGYPSPDSTP
jgi:uncharacterized repeat protein (TIGR01451 family)